MKSASPVEGIVTLLTDFGLEDTYVGVMKGVLLTCAPALRLVDLSHQVAPQDTLGAEFLLEQSYAWFPRGSVHLCVVDPGVGSERAALAASANGHFFVAPDNGVLGFLARARDARFHRVDVAALGLEPPSRTFHGRDVFARVAAWLASGARQLEELGPVHAPLASARSKPERAASALHGRLVWVDHFGNLITDLPGAWLAGLERVWLAARELRVVGTYAEANRGECVALVSSFGSIELAVREGSAAAELGFARGAQLSLSLEEPTR